MNRSVAPLALIAVMLVGACGGDDGEANTDASSAVPTTNGVASTTTTTAGSTTSSPAGPAVSQEALAFLDCESLTSGEWWECRRAGGVAYIIETTDPAAAVVAQVRAHPDYDRNTSVIFETDGGFIFVVGFDGFEHIHTTVGGLPGMRVVDTDVL